MEARSAYARDHARHRIERKLGAQARRGERDEAARWWGRGSGERGGMCVSSPRRSRLVRVRGRERVA